MPKGDAIERVKVPEGGFWWLAIGILVVYGVVFWSLPDAPVFWSPDEGGRYLDMRRMVESGRWSHPLPYPGRELDPELAQVPLQYFRVEDGQIYSWWPASFPFLSSLPYRLFGFRGIYLIPLLSSFLLSVGVYVFVGDLDRRWRLAAMAASGAASPTVFYGFTFWEHDLAAALVLLASFLIVRGLANDSVTRLAAGATLLALAVALRVESIVFAIGIAIAGLLVTFARARSGSHPLARRHFLWLGGGLALAILGLTKLPLVSEHFERYYRLDLRLATARFRGWDALTELLAGSGIHGGFEPGSLAAGVGVVVLGLALVSPLLVKVEDSRRVWVRGILGLAWVTWLGLGTLALATSFPYVSLHGLGITLPYLIWLTAFFQTADVETRFWALAGLTSLGSYLLLSLLLGWNGQGGLQWGPRYALPLAPIGIVAVFRGSARASRVTKLQILAMVALAFGLQARGISTMNTSREVYRSWERELLALPRDALLTTSSPILALTLPRVYEERRLLRLDRGEEVELSSASRFSPVCRVEVEQALLRIDCQDR